MNDDEIKEEERRLRRLRFLVDFSIQLISTQDMTHNEAIKIVEGVRKQVLRLFPGKEETFELIYAPRFRRILNEKFRRS